jgi:hypothetical protein
MGMIRIRREFLIDSLVSSLTREFGDTEAPPSLGKWVKTTSIILDGKPFTFHKHEYLEQPYNDHHPYQVEIKATQLGLTTKAMLRSFYACRFRSEFKGVLYLFPSRSDVMDFSKGRVTPMIEENPETIGNWIRDTDSAGIKRVWTSFLYLRGMVSRVGLKSIPVDFIVFDELDEAPQNMVNMALKRMAHSEYKEVLMLSNSTLPDYGIDKAFQYTDQRFWLVKCERCGHYTDLVETFPDCLIELDNRVIRACERCRKEINPSIGQWVAKKPSVTERRGYQYSQLFSHFVDPAEILHDYRTTNDLTNFYNLTIGIAYVEAHNRLTLDQIYALCGDHGIESQDPGPCSMGVDEGKNLHVVIGKNRDGTGSIIHLGEYLDWSELDKLMNAFNVSRCVVDALPETRNARAFAKRFPGRVYLNFYNEHQKGVYKWNDLDCTVSCNRTESLDASHVDISESKVYLPRRCEILETFAKHMCNVAKKIEEDEETGDKRYIYVRLGEDHFRHAFNYEAIARHYIRGGFFGDVNI